MVRYGHLLEGDLLGVLEVRVGLPDVVEPGDGQQTVVGAHVTWESQSVLHPALGEKYIGGVRLKPGRKCQRAEKPGEVHSAEATGREMNAPDKQ